MKFEVFCQHEDYAMILNFYIFGIEPNGTKKICTSLDDMEFEEYTEGALIENPTFSLKGRITKPFLQAMANELDRIGVKAEGKPILENELTAVKGHLEDMRKIVGKQLKVSF